MSFELGDRVTVVKLENDVLGVNGRVGTVSARHAMDAETYLVDMDGGLSLAVPGTDLLPAKMAGKYDKQLDALSRALMSAMGCLVQEDTPDCGHDGLCGGHGRFSYCAVHDWDEDWMDFEAGRLCLYARGIAEKLVGGPEMAEYWEAVDRSLARG